jgi:hypothetical protein
MNTGAWMRGNLATQGYCLDGDSRRQLWLGLRFSTAVCLPLVVLALVLESSVMAFALSAVAFVAGFTSRHPFDYIWNHGVRHVAGAPALPANPPRRRHAFKLGTAWLLAVAALLAIGATTAALVLGGLLLTSCAVVTAINFCVPSQALAWWERRTTRQRVLG